MSVSAFFWVVPGLYLLFSIAFAVVGWHPLGTRSARWAAAGFLVGAAGSIFDTQRDHLPHLVALASPAHWVGIYCLLNALLTRKGEAMPRLPMIVLGSVAAVIHVAFMFFWPSTPARIIALNALVPLMFVLALPGLYRTRKSAIDTALAVLCSLTAISYPIRLAAFIIGRQYAEIGASPSWNGYTIPFYIAIASIGVFTALCLMLATGVDLIAAQMRENVVDPLTGIANRRAVDRWIAEEAQTGARYGGALMIDLDHFKRINDSHGHAAGDQVLRAVANALATKLDGFADVARIGGEEFAALIYTENAHATPSLALAVRSTIAEIRFHGSLEMLRPTASVGFAIRDDGLDMEELLKRADMATYQAKSAGRNQTMQAACRDGLIVLSKVA